MNIIDILIIIVILIFGVIGAQRGFLKQVVTTLGFLIVVVVAYYLKNPLAEFLSLHIPFLKFSSNITNSTSLNIIFFQATSFIVIVILLESLLQSLIRITGILEKILKATIILGIPSKILGFIAGLIEGIVIVFIALFFLKQPVLDINVVDNSKYADKILNHTPVLSNMSKGMVKTLNDIYELLDESDKLDGNELDLRSIDIMLEHKLIKPRYVRKLIDANKIDVKGIDKVLNKYE